MGRRGHPHPASSNRNHSWLHLSFHPRPSSNRRRKDKEDHHHHHHGHHGSGTWHYLAIAATDHYRHNVVHHDGLDDYDSCMSTTSTTGASIDDGTFCNEQHRSLLISLDSCVSNTTSIITTTTASSSTTTPSRTTQKHHHHRVHFGNCEIQTYHQVLGNHPYCSPEGCPIELGWSVVDSSIMSVDDYELDRDYHRRLYNSSGVVDDNNDLRLTYEERRTILKDYPNGEIRKSNRRMNRERTTMMLGCHHHHHHRHKSNNIGKFFFNNETDDDE